MKGCLYGDIYKITFKKELLFNSTTPPFYITWLKSVAKTPRHQIACKTLIEYIPKKKTSATHQVSGQVMNIYCHKVLLYHYKLPLSKTPKSLLLQRLNPSGPLFGDCYETEGAAVQTVQQNLNVTTVLAVKIRQRPAPPAYT